MAKKKTVNTKVEAANVRKAASRAEKDNKKKAEVEAMEDAKWSKGSKKNDKKELEAQKKAEALRRKQEAQKQLEEEEKALNKPKAAAKPNYTKKFVYTPKSSVSAGTKKSTDAAVTEDKKQSEEETASSKKKNAKIDKVLTENDIEKHPERRFKTALRDFEERELKNYRAEYPGLRLSQLKEIMYKDFQKSPENPFNQANVFSYNTSIEEVNRIIRGEPAAEEKNKEEGDEEQEEEGTGSEENAQGEASGENKDAAAPKAATSY